MNLTILNYAYVIIAVQALIVFLEVYVNFKRTGAVKNMLLIVIFTSFFMAVANVYCNYTSYNRWIVQFPIVVLLAASIIFFSLLYQHKLKRYIIAFAVSMVLFQLSFFLYFSFAHPIDTSISILKISEIRIFRSIIRYCFIAGMFIIIVDIFVKILKKYNSTNIYFREVKKWAAFLVFTLLLLLISSVLKNTLPAYEFVSQLFILVSVFLMLLTFLFRPKFLNRSRLKIALGDYFTSIENSKISGIEFSEAFFGRLYYLDQDASLEKFSKDLRVNSEELYRYIYKNYQFGFNDLLNKHRVSYFIDLVNNKRFSNYTIDALAQKSGFSSRHHLYKPFKKFHGGNPSDLVRSVRD